MGEVHSDFLPDEVSTADLSAWADIMPTQFSVLCVSLFADFFVVDEAGAVHMLEVSASKIARIAASEDEFRRRCMADLDGWLLRSLVDRCRLEGMNPSDTQCYAFTTLPIFGGEYKSSNIWLCSWRDWISFTASVYAQTKDLPDGARVSIKIVD